MSVIAPGSRGISGGRFATGSPLSQLGETSPQCGRCKCVGGRSRSRSRTYGEHNSYNSGSKYSESRATSLARLLRESQEHPGIGRSQTIAIGAIAIEGENV